MQEEIKSIEAKLNKEFIKRKIDDECRTILNDIEGIKTEAFKLEDKRRTLETQIRNLKTKNSTILDEENFLIKQIESNYFTKN